MNDARRAIPSVERLLTSPALEPLLAREPRVRVVELLRGLLDEVRASGNAVDDAEWYAAQLTQRIERANQPSLHAVINATGVVLHTNLGRAPLSPSALAAIERVAHGYSNLEYDVDQGTRGSRYTHCEQLLRELTGAQAALVVNNNAAALVLALNTIALASPALISRGELLEIGDSFRIAEIAERAVVTLREVGSTNRTHLRDYENSLAGAAAILKVHPSNFSISGFVSAVATDELAHLAQRAGIPLLHDLGSGLIESLADLGLSGEPTAAEALRAGADIVTMSGDKLLAGPQAGIIIGRADLIAAMKRNPLCRALRVDKLTLAALEATLLSYARGTARAELPVLRMLSAGLPELRERAARLVAALPAAADISDGFSAVGGGAFPAARLPTALVVLVAPSAAGLESRLRSATPPVIGRIANERVVLDLRTVLPEQDATLASVIAHG
ncbi:MAG: L-seryl-tRNA(Sec) selenium transferase [Gemmatimonadota bacterium]